MKYILLIHTQVKLTRSCSGSQYRPVELYPLLIILAVVRSRFVKSWMRYCVNYCSWDITSLNLKPKTICKRQVPLTNYTLLKVYLTGRGFFYLQTMVDSVECRQELLRNRGPQQKSNPAFHWTAPGDQNEKSYLRISLHRVPLRSGLKKKSLLMYILLWYRKNLHPQVQLKRMW